MGKGSGGQMRATGGNVRFEAAEKSEVFERTPGWSTIITASNSQTSLDNSLLKTSFECGVGLVETSSGRNWSRASLLEYKLRTSQGVELDIVIYYL